MRQPWLKFFPSDWRSDPALRCCGLAARGLWLEMINLMHEADPRGSLLLNGRQITPRMLANLIGVSPEEVTALLEELESAGVFSRDADGTIYCRKMRRDEEKAAQARAWGEQGGNPKLKPREKRSHKANGAAPVRAGDNPSLKGGDKPQTRALPEARNQIPEPPLTPPPGGDSGGRDLDDSGEEKPQSPDPTLAPDAALMAAYQRFVRAYPKPPRGAEQAAALREFRAAVHRGHDPDAIVQGAEAYARERAEDQRPNAAQFTAGAVTWLRGDRWTGAPPGAPAARKASSAVTPIRPGTPQWEAWRNHKIACGERVSWMDSLARAGEAYPAPSEWPPAAA